MVVFGVWFLLCRVLNGMIFSEMCFGGKAGVRRRW